MIDPYLTIRLQLGVEGQPAIYVNVVPIEIRPDLPRAINEAIEQAAARLRENIAGDLMAADLS